MLSNVIRNTALFKNTPRSKKDRILIQEPCYFERPAERKDVGEPGIYIYKTPYSQLGQLPLKDIGTNLTFPTGPGVGLGGRYLGRCLDETFRTSCESLVEGTGEGWVNVGGFVFFCEQKHGKKERKGWEDRVFLKPGSIFYQENGCVCVCVYFPWIVQDAWDGIHI